KRRLIRRSRLDTSTAGSLKVRVGRNICTPPSKRKRDRSSSFTLRRPPEQSACRFPEGLACRDDTRSAAFGGRPAAVASAGRADRRTAGPFVVLSPRPAVRPSARLRGFLPV